MKSTTFVAILLTFLSLLLVLVAAVTFLWQGRQLAATRLSLLQEERAASEATATIVRSYLAAREEGLATAHALATTTAADLAQSQRAYLALEATSTAGRVERAALATRVASLEAVFLQPPSVAIISPRPGPRLQEENPAGAEQIVVAGSHPQGISGLQLSLAGDQTSFAASGETFRVFSYTLPAPLSPGLYTVTATITATNNLTATTTALFDVSEPVGEESDDPQSRIVPTFSFSSYPVFFKPAAMPLIVKKMARNSA